MMAVRRSKAVSDTFWWTPKAWCSKPRFTAQRSRTGTASRSYWNLHGIASHSASLICGWTQATPAKAKAQTGWKGYWDGRPR